MIRGFASLLSLLTLLPTGQHNLREASEAFYLIPAVGLVVGTLSALPATLINKPILSAALVTLVAYLITGFIHLDGLADFSDAIASGRRGAEAVKVMKEPWRGAYAVVSVTLTVLTVFSANYYLADVPALIVVAHVTSYESLFLIAVFSPRPQHGGLGKLFVEKAKESRKVAGNLLTLASTLTAALVVIHFLGWYQSFWKAIYLTLILLTSVLVVTAINLRVAVKMVGYVSGDALGFNLEVCRAVTLVVAATLG